MPFGKELACADIWEVLAHITQLINALLATPVFFAKVAQELCSAAPVHICIRDHPFEFCLLAALADAGAPLQVSMTHI
jgi:hypothetical protein